MVCLLLISRDETPQVPEDGDTADMALPARNEPNFHFTRTTQSCVQSSIDNNNIRSSQARENGPLSVNGKSDMGGTCSTRGKLICAYKTLVAKPEMHRLLRKTQYRR
jgi:hypothetical protein